MIINLPDGWVIEPISDDRWMEIHEGVEDDHILIRNEKTGQVITLGELRGGDEETKDWDPSNHPRHPAGAPDSAGGEFAKKPESGSDGEAEYSPPSGPESLAAAQRLRDELD